MKSSNLKIAALFLVFIVITALSTFGLMKGSNPSGANSKEEIQAIVKEFIEKNPELIIKSLN